MKKRLFVAGAILSLLIVSPIAKAAGKIAGYQYYIFSNGDYPLENNTIHFIPCYPKNSDCQELSNTISTEVKKALSDLDRAKLTVDEPREAWALFTQLDQRFLSILSTKTGYKTTQTKKKGVYSFTCPTQSCLVYSSAFSNNHFSYWVVIHPSWKRLDLGPGKEMSADK
ncbi:MAG: hypothetical protein WCD18_09490 [Thermosynechococcaceae cyanobacterium]